MFKLALFYQHNINESTRLGIWKIEEPEEFFLQKVPLQREITHPNKRLQHLAARWLLHFLFPDFPYKDILVANTRKPYLPDEQYHFSISHTGNFAAAIVSEDQRVGIDIEFISPKIESISHKFLHGNDIMLMDASIVNYSHRELLAFMWSAKESLFKWHSLGGIDFKENFQLTGVVANNGPNAIQMPFIFEKDTHSRYLPVNGYFLQEAGLVLSWLATR